ncbi:alpha-L-iduronidase-like isoform X3 [Pocillopora verrucosa]|uniref:alpha-L-iduronidase-like isoform X3 n=1 Tax=Pocillopora verrucosa TaxID=203993 RepID=UPI00279762C7|nr:alpha-L-iduronidase-like isoform X3 [Pocillopora verrucosa]
MVASLLVEPNRVVSEINHLGKEAGINSSLLSRPHSGSNSVNIPMRQANVSEKYRTSMAGGNMCLKGLVYVVLVLLANRVETKSFSGNAVVDASKVIGPLEHFWESTGFCPPDPHQDFHKFIFANDELQNLAYVGSVPNNGIKQVRIHWLLDLVSMKLENDKLVYNFTFLDKAMKLLIENDLRPGFELMGNPSNFFSDFDDTAQIYSWRNLVESLGKHLIEVFGLEEICQWNFESWNEPENKQHFDGLHVSTKGYLMYYDACSEGLKMAHPSLRLGGPATGYPDKHPIFWSLLQHCNNGTNFFTGQRGVRLDFISFHIKGQGHSLTILHNETVVIGEIAKLIPKYITTPIYNDEGDPLVGWNLAEEWRADATYAAIVVKILVQHQDWFLKSNFSIRYNLLSNDNGFISYPPVHFRQRTLLARFQMNHSHPRKEPIRSLGPSIVSSSTLNLHLTLPLPGVSLLHVCAKTVSAPPKVEGVRLISVSPYEVLVVWKDVPSRCITTFEVLYSEKSPGGPFKRVNEIDVIFTSFHHMMSQADRNNVEGWYSIVAVDYWGRYSPGSVPIKHNKTK